MKNANTTLKLYESTRKNLRLLAALQDRTMMEVAEELVANALEEAEQKRKKKSDDLKLQEHFDKQAI
ncbi:MAG TPA: hypothetical protein VLA24_09455 [Pseudomonadales bacterium]|nr:hypothetical protein [Pseudomonadales bacterium]